MFYFVVFFFFLICARGTNHFISTVSFPIQSVTQRRGIDVCLTMDVSSIFCIKDCKVLSKPGVNNQILQGKDCINGWALFLISHSRRMKMAQIKGRV